MQLLHRLLPARAMFHAWQKQPKWAIQGACTLLLAASSGAWAQNPSYPAPASQTYPQQQYPAQQPYPAQQQPYPAQQQTYPSQPQYPGNGQYPNAAQQPYPPSAPPPAPMSPQQLDGLVSRIALYPDPLLAQTLTASTFWNEVPDAAGWAQQHSYLSGDALSQAVQADQLGYDPSLLGLLPFPSVLDMMARDPGWTQQLGAAVLNQRPDVMDAVQRMRQQARNYGSLTPNGYENVVADDGYIQIQPTNAGFLYVPVYDPYLVYGPPRPGFAVGAAIHFGPRVVIAPSFVSSGWWAGPGFSWRSHGILIGGGLWGRTWGNRGAYVHPYERGGYAHYAGPRVERHEFGRPR